MCFNFRVLRLPYNIFSRKEHNLGLPPAGLTIKSLRGSFKKKKEILFVVEFRVKKMIVDPLKAPNPK